MAAKLELVLASKASQVDLEPVHQVVRVLNDTGSDWLQTGRINLKLIDDAGIRALNSTYSGQNKATDVLSFSYIENGQAPEDGELGDIAVSLETAERQAAAADTSLANELALLTLHGILHIHGFDHAASGDRENMDRLQRQVLTKANLTYRDFKWA